MIRRFIGRCRKFGRYNYAVRQFFSDAGFKERTRREFEAQLRQSNNQQ